MALTAERAASAVQMLRMLRDDVEADIHKLEGKPFDGPTAAAMFGNQGAQIDALARVLIEHLEIDEVVEIPHEHEWVDVSTIDGAGNRERHYVCSGCQARRMVREVVETGEPA